MTPKPKITIAIPVYNRAQLVKRTLDSIAAQTYRPLSVILVDNNSTDETLQVLNAWRDRHNRPDFDIQVLSEPKAGATAARNTALAATQTPWLMFFDSDDTMIPEHVANAMAAVEDMPDADIVGWNVNLSFLDGRVMRKHFAQQNVLYDCIIHGTMATQRYMCRTELFRKAGGWDETVAVWNDIELGVRLLLLPDIKVMKLGGEPPVTVYQTQESITGLSYHKNGKEREHSLHTILKNLPAQHHGLIALKMAILASLYKKEGHLEDADRLMADAMYCALTKKDRMAVRLAYLYGCTVHRGVGRIMSIFYR